MNNELKKLREQRNEIVGITTKVSNFDLELSEMGTLFNLLDTKKAELTNQIKQIEKALVEEQGIVDIKVNDIFVDMVWEDEFIITEIYYDANEQTISVNIKYLTGVCKNNITKHSMAVMQNRINEKKLLKIN